MFMRILFTQRHIFAPQNIRAHVDVKFEDKMASCRAKKGRFVSNKAKTRRMEGLLLRYFGRVCCLGLRNEISPSFFITLNDYFQTHFVAPALTWCNMGIRISVCSSVRVCVRQAVNICDHPRVNPLELKSTH